MLEATARSTRQAEGQRQVLNERASVSGLLLLGLHLGLVDETTVQEAFQQRTLPERVADVGNRLAHWYEAHYARTAPAGGDIPSIPLFECTLGNDDDTHMETCGMDGGSLLIFGHEFYLTQINMAELPRSLATAVALSLDLLRDFIPLMLPEDLLARNWWTEEQLDFFLTLKMQGLLEQDDPDALIAFMTQNREVGCEMYSEIPDQDEARKILGDAQHWTAPMPPWDTDYRDTQQRDHTVLADTLLKWIWGWRYTAPALYEHPLTRFVRRVATRYRRHSRRLALLNGSPAQWFFPEETVSLEICLPVFLGYPWEEELMNLQFEHVGNTGEPVCAALLLDPDALPKTGETLRCIAEGLGLLADLSHRLEALET